MTDNPTETPASTGDVPDWLIPGRVYDILKWLGLIVLPALAVFVNTVGPAWGWPHVDAIVTTLNAHRHPRRRAHRRQRHQTTHRPRRITTHSSAPSGIAGDSNRVNLRPDGADFALWQRASRARFLPTFCPHYP